MSTPEGRVKKKVKEVIAKYGDKIDSYWPVPAGYGESHLDCILCVCGLFVAIETKAPKGKLTPRQQHRVRTTSLAGGKVFIIDGTPDTDTYDELDAWLALAVRK